MDTKCDCNFEFEVEQKRINKFFKKIKFGPKQGSIQWLEDRKTRIGGSEIATLLGLNPWRKIHDLVSEKIGLTHFQGNLATRWGQMFEPITRDFSAQIFMMESIEEYPSIPGKISDQWYSPDGIGIVEFISENGDKVYYIILFEFKAPLKSIPDGKIPKYYLPQVLTGLDSIPICDYAIFVNNCYRKCKFEDLETDKYDRTFHSLDMYRGVKPITYAFGVVCFKQNKENPESSGCITDNEEILILNKSKSSPIDFGNESEKVIDKLLELVESKRVQLVYSPIIYKSKNIKSIPLVSEHQIDHEYKYSESVCELKSFIESISYSDDSYFIGYLPWKLVKTDVILEHRDESWVDNIKNPVENTISIIKKLNSIQDKEKREQEYYKIYSSQFEQVPDYEDIPVDISEVYKNMMNDYSEIVELYD